jgi:integrase/recombinase XerD
MDESKALTVIDAFVPSLAQTSNALPIHFGEFCTPTYTAWDDFFCGMIQNPHTRAAYERAVRRFFAWLPSQILLREVTPGIVGRYFGDMNGYSIPTKKLHLAGLRAFFDLLVQRHVMAINPAASVRGQRYQAVEGRTQEISLEQARKLIASVRTQTISSDGSMRPLLVGLRDRAIIGVMFYTAARAGAVARLTLKDLRDDGLQYSLRFHEKGGKQRDIPVRADLQQWLMAYVKAAALSDSDPSEPLFRTGIRRTRVLTVTAMTNIDICRMVKRRVTDAGLPGEISPHSFRVATITDLLKHGAALEDVQYLAGHADPRTTRLYDRRQKRVTRNLVERISDLTNETSS